jgi:heat shock protein HslJ
MKHLYLVAALLVVIVGGLATLLAYQIGFFAAEPQTEVSDEPKIQQPFTGAYAPIATSTWTLVRYSDGSDLTGAPAQYRASFARNTFSAQWCNTLIAPYTVSDDTPPMMRFSILQRSKMLCEETQMRPENALAESMRKGLEVTTLTATTLQVRGRETGFVFEFRR